MNVEGELDYAQTLLLPDQPYALCVDEGHDPCVDGTKQSQQSNNASEKKIKAGYMHDDK